MFEAVLGTSRIHNIVVACQGRDGRERVFVIGLRFRQDGRINEALLHIYSRQQFAVDIAVIMRRASGELIPLLGGLNKLRALLAIRRCVCVYIYSLWWTKALTHQRNRVLRCLYHCQIT